ncbi:MAG: cobalt ECF transporter T component CbiQ [Candidatus Poribacteria bacterium]
MPSINIDEYSNINSIINRRDPRIKIILFFLFILIILSTRPELFLVFVIYAVIIFVLMLLSKIPIKFIIKRSLVIIPFVIMIAIFTPFLKKGEIAGGYSLGNIKLNVSYDGLMVFWNVLIKSYLSILCMILLTASTKFSDLLKAFEKLKIPRLIVILLSFTYRYIFVFQDELQSMTRAKESRSYGKKRWINFKTLANMVGVLFIRAYERGERVYYAMRSRGFEGSIKTMTDMTLTKSDIYFLSVIVTILILIRILSEWTVHLL